MKRERLKRCIGVTDYIEVVDFLYFVQRNCYFQETALCFGVVDMGLLFQEIGSPVSIGLPHFLSLFLLSVHSLGPAAIILHLRPCVLVGLAGIIYWRLA